MKASLNAFMHGLIDYAGLFPPSGLDMKPAFENFLSYRNSADAAMLSAFVIPAARLSGLDGFTSEIKSYKHKPVHFSILAGGGETASDCLSAVEKAMEQIHRFYELHSSGVQAAVMEIRLPNPLPEKNELSELLTKIRSLTNSHIPNAVDIFFEPVRDENWNQYTETLTGLLAELKDDNSGKTGFKLRCGGVEAHMFPTIEQAARALHLCVSRDVAFKATAGLHHPVRHFNDGVNCRMHGFLNVFGSAILGKTHQWPEETYRKMLGDEQASNFIFTDAGFSWGDAETGIDHITKIRTELATSYGSCSFMEPLEDLEALGLR